MPNTELKTPAQIVKPKIRFISLCPRGKNMVRGIYKSTSEWDLQVVTKAMNERGELHALIYPANRLDADGEWADRETVRKMAHDYVASGGQIDIRHDEQPVGDRVQLVETYIVKAGDPDWPEHEGAWAGVFRIAKGDPLREVYRSGAWGGVSIGGQAQIQPGVAPPSLFAKAVDASANTTTPSSEENKMDENTLRALLKENAEAQSGALTEALKAGLVELAKALKPEEPKEEVKKADANFDPTDKAQVEKKLAELRKAELLKSLDLNSAESLEAHLKTFEVSKADQASLQPNGSPASQDAYAVLAKGLVEIMDGGQ